MNDDVNHCGSANGIFAAYLLDGLRALGEVNKFFGRKTSNEEQGEGLANEIKRPKNNEEGFTTTNSPIRITKILFVSSIISIEKPVSTKLKIEGY